jgi:hypothetical protein
MDPEFTWYRSKLTAEQNTSLYKKNAPINKMNPTKGSDRMSTVKA